MKGILVVLTGFILLPGSVIMLLSANFGALKGYLIGAICFFGFLTMLTFIWTFGLPGTVPLTGPVGPQPTFKQFANYWGFEPHLCRAYRAQTKDQASYCSSFRSWDTHCG